MKQRTLLTLFLGLAILPGANLAHASTDAEITHWVQEALRNDPRCQTSDALVHVENGIVTITGTTPTLAGKRYADRETKKIQGVRGVLNEISVQPVVRDDLDIANDIRRRIAVSPAIELHDVQVLVIKGAVTLAGSVATLTEFSQAGLLASEVRGVREVNNKLLVQFIGHRSDKEIKDDALAALNRKAYLTGLPIAVDVHDGVIQLDGSVGSVYEKDRAEDAVRWLSGIRSVTNLLAVKPAENRGTRKAPASYSDEQVRQSVVATLGQDSRITVTNIAATVVDGFVTLAGAVPNHLQARLAQQDATDVIGVSGVTSRLAVQSPTRQDSELKADVLFVIDSDARLAGQGIQVKATNTVVTLSGSVTGWYEKNHAEDITLRVRGVKNVINDLAISRSEKVLDRAVEQAIKARLTWNAPTRAVAGNIHIAVKNGVATLTGNVGTWAEWRDAEHVAFGTAGAWLVKNNLTVNGHANSMQESDYKSIFDMYDDDLSNR